MTKETWVGWAQRLQAIAQSGLTYTAEDSYDAERYLQILDIAAEITAVSSNLPLDKIHNLWAAENGYATPKVDVRAGVFRDDAILLVREKADGDRWTLPGGWADVGDSPKNAIEREVFEESGFQTKATKLAFCYDRNKHPHPPILFHTYKLYFLCEIIGGSAETSNETSEVRFFQRDEIPVDELSLSRVLPAQIDLLFDHHYNQAKPTNFD